MHTQPLVSIIQALEMIYLCDKFILKLGRCFPEKVISKNGSCFMENAWPQFYFRESVLCFAHDAPS